MRQKSILNKFLNHSLIKDLLLTEMAMSLKDFKDRILHLQFQLVENWCLCKWCQLFDIENDNFCHWLTEFKVYANAIYYIKLKSGNKRKTLIKEFIENYDYNDSDKIFSIIQDKFIQEGIQDISQIKTVSIEFSQKIEKLIDALCSTTSINTYIREEFQLDHD